MQGLGSKDSLNLRDGIRKVENFRRSNLRGGSQIYICLWISDKIRIKFLLLLLWQLNRISNGGVKKRPSPLRALRSNA